MKLNDIQGYNEAQAYTGELASLEPNGYICKIINARIDSVGTMGRQQLILQIDIAEGNETNRFQKMFSGGMEKWPNSGIFRQGIPLAGDSPHAMGFFKGLITVIENSNNFKIDGTKELEPQLKGKLLGLVYGREEYETQTGTAWTCNPKQPRSVESIRSGNFKVPEDKPLNNNVKFMANTQHFSNIEKVDDDDDLLF